VQGLEVATDIEWAESVCMDTAWIPQVPNDFDCLTMVAVDGGALVADRNGTHP
jgi:hypothetical protein